jgi:hypothetical protein
MRHGVYYQPKAVPCECGSTDAYWHGTVSRVYCCDACWKAIKDKQPREDYTDYRPGKEELK